MSAALDSLASLALFRISHEEFTARTAMYMVAP